MDIRKFFGGAGAAKTNSTPKKGTEVSVAPKSPKKTLSQQQSKGKSRSNDLDKPRTDLKEIQVKSKKSKETGNSKKRKNDKGGNTDETNSTSKKDTDFSAEPKSQKKTPVKQSQPKRQNKEKPRSDDLEKPRTNLEISAKSKQSKETGINKKKDKNGNIEEDDISSIAQGNKVSGKYDNNKKEFTILSEEEEDKSDRLSSPVIRRTSKKKQQRQIDSSEEDDFVEIKSTSAKRKKRSLKKGVIFDSDSEDEEPLSKKRNKRRKKEYHLSSDEEAKQTSIQEAFQHVKAKTKPKSVPAAKCSPPVSKKEINVVDFFGTSPVQRVEHKTALGDHKKPSKVKPNTVEDDFELHDDDDFTETLHQLDEIEQSEAKKIKLDEDNATSSSLSSKLAEKIKESHRVEQTPEKQPATRNSPAKTPSKRVDSQSRTPSKGVESKTKTPEKVVESKATTPSKAEMSKAVKTPTSAVRPSTKKTSPEKSETKKYAFKSYLSREGPRSLGSKEVPQGGENCLEGLTFVITGVLESFERDDAKSILERYGGRVTGSVSKKTSYLIVGRDAGESKLNKANSFGTKIIDEDGMLDLIRTLPGKKSKYEIEAEKESKSKPTKKTPSKSKPEQVTKTPSQSTPSESSTTKNISDTHQKDPPQVETGTDTVNDEKPVSVESLLWVDKYKPVSLKQIIGQQGDKSNAKKLLNWIKNWHKNITSGKKPAFNRFNDDGSGHRAALLSGPPGVGKTTTAHLVCKEAGFSFVELNASDTRSKKHLKEEVAESLNNHSLAGIFGTSACKIEDGQYHCLIMDEVDGMAGNEDRGGIQELVSLIKSTKIPIICMCNDRNHPKIRTLANYCFDLRFQRPRVEQIKSAMMSLAFKEGIKIPPPALNDIIVASNQDIRQVIHNISMWSATDKNMSFDQVKKDSSNAKKDLKLGAFDVVRKVFSSGEETAHMTVNDKSDLFFHDYSFGPLFVQENYISVQPSQARGNINKHLQLLSYAADSIAAGDRVDRLVRGQSQWGLLPVQAIFSSVIPGDMMRGYLGGQIQFPAWLGKNSTRNKNDRILQELKSHMRLRISCDKRGLNIEYLPHLRHSLTLPLIKQGSEGVPDVIKCLDEYDLIKEDFDSILEVSQWPHSKDVMSMVESKTKAAFTRAYNKEVHLTPYAVGSLAKKGRRGGAAAADTLELGLEEGEEGSLTIVESDEEDDDLSADSMIKKKKPATSRSSTAGSTSSGKDKGKSSGKGKGRGKSSSKGKAK